jgi:hypothetical protein
MKIHRSLLALALFGLSSTTFAQWQWQEADGRKVFSDRAPPPGVADKNILKRPSTQVRAPAAQASAAQTAAGDGSASESGSTPPLVGTAPTAGVDKDLVAKKKQAADAEAAKRRAEEERVAKIRIENCARAKQAKATFDSGLRIARTNANGEREVLDDAARAAERARVQAVMDSECR